MVRIILSHQAKKFTDKEKITEDDLFDIIKKFIRVCQGDKTNLDIRKMKGDWKGFYRIRMGRIRVIVKINIDSGVVYLDRVDYRGNVYK